MKYIFYITNHGYGHASRNVPIIEELIQRDKNAKILIKSDDERCAFLKRNMKNVGKSIVYYTDCTEVGVLTEVGTPVIDPKATLEAIKEDYKKWDYYQRREVDFLRRERPDVVICDIISWGLKAASIAGVPSLLIGNFTWSSIYSSFFDKEIYRPYTENYSLANRAIWYEIHAKELEALVTDWKQVSFVSRKVNVSEVERIKADHSKPIVFFSLGGSVEIDKEYDVSKLPYDFITTKGVRLIGDNVFETPSDMINTPDYFAASDFIIVKGGWSSIAEVMLQKKKCALLLRGDNTEDNETKKLLEKKKQCITIKYDDLNDIGNIIDRITELNPEEYTYHNSTSEICDIIIELVGEDRY